MSERLQELLCHLGVLLFLLAMLEGAALPRMRSPRIGLSAHVSGILSGMFLVVVGLLSARLSLPEALAPWIAHVLWVSLYVTWIGITLGGVWGTGQTMPIAGAGLIATRSQELVASILIVGGSLGTTAAIVLLLIQWSWRTA